MTSLQVIAKGTGEMLLRYFQKCSSLFFAITSSIRVPGKLHCFVSLCHQVSSPLQEPTQQSRILEH